MSAGQSALVAQLMELQGGKCAICGGIKGKKADDDLVVEHDHHTGLIRGLLCRGCNTAEGMGCGAFSPQGGQRHYWEECGFCTYRRQPPVCWVGWTTRYESAWGGWGGAAPHLPAVYRSSFERVARAAA